MKNTTIALLVAGLLTVGCTGASGSGDTQSSSTAMSVSTPTQTPIVPTATAVPAPTLQPPCTDPVGNGWAFAESGTVEIAVEIEGTEFLWAITLNSTESPNEAYVRLIQLDSDNPGYGWIVGEDTYRFGTVLTDGETTALRLKNFDGSTANLHFLKCPTGVYTKFRPENSGEADS